MNLQSVVSLCAFVLLLGFQKVVSEGNNQQIRRNADNDTNLCAHDCYMAIQPLLAHIFDNKENQNQHQNFIKKENIELHKINDDLRKSNEDLRKLLAESIQQQNNNAKIDELTAKINEMKETHKKDLTNLNENLEDDKVIKKFKTIKNDLEIQNIEEHKVSSCENSFLKLNRIESALVDIKDRLPFRKTPSCRSLPSGIHQIKLRPGELSVLCNADIDDGGWIVIQNRFDGSVDFNRSWTDYSQGFGELDGEFFIGFENLHRILKLQHFELYIHMVHFNGTVDFANYDNFQIGNEQEAFELKSLGDYYGTGYDQMIEKLNCKFATFDNIDLRDCAIRKGPSWYRYFCDGNNLNGKYFNSATEDWKSMHWNNVDSLKSMQMLIRPVK